jgi:hypothetical protein
VCRYNPDGSLIDNSSIRYKLREGDDIGEYEQTSIRYTGKANPSKTFQLLQTATGSDSETDAKLAQATARRQVRRRLSHVMNLRISCHRLTLMTLLTSVTLEPRFRPEHFVFCRKQSENEDFQLRLQHLMTSQLTRDLDHQDAMCVSFTCDQ